MKIISILINTPYRKCTPLTLQKLGRLAIDVTVFFGYNLQRAVFDISNNTVCTCLGDFTVLQDIDRQCYKASLINIFQLISLLCHGLNGRGYNSPCNAVIVHFACPVDYIAEGFEAPNVE